MMVGPARQVGRMIGVFKRITGIKTLPGPEDVVDPVAEQVAAIERLGVFDKQAYLAADPELAVSGIDPIRHYVTVGAREGRSPCMHFDTVYYYGTNPDIARSDVNPLIHYFEFGWLEGRNPSADFDGKWYESTHLANLDKRWNPLLHYLQAGSSSGLEIRPVRDAAYRVLAESGVFDADYYRESYPDIDADAIDPVRHYLKHGAAEGRNPSAFFDTKYYLKHNPDIAARRINPLVHFCTRGWKELRNPHPDFDVWWYWSNHLDPASEHVNPLQHFLAVGRAMGLSAAPARRVSQRAGEGATLPEGRKPRRLCLFAGYDADGIIDDCVVDYLRELSRFAEIHYFADCEMQPGELDKILPFVASARAERHGEYDFGSYSRLARQLGWKLVEQYDELVLANDSCYLLRGLDHVFQKMDAKACDWWGMQATKGLASTRGNPRNRFLRPIPLHAVKLSMLSGFESDYRYDFHVGSYFVVYRKPVIRDAYFRKMLDSVVAQEHKRNLILKYEVGITRGLIANGHSFETFVDNLYPFHPIYTNWYFQLLDEGFPFLKRYLLSENHYRVPRLFNWAERIRRKVPEAPVESIQRNLQRVVEPEKLHVNLHVGSARLEDAGEPPKKLLTQAQFLAADQSSPKYAHWWGFPVCAFTRNFSGNERALFEHVKNDPGIKKILFTRGRNVEVDGVDVEVVPLNSQRGQYLLMRCGQVFIKHSPTRNLVYPLVPELHNLINVWHGIPFKRIGYASLDMQDKLGAIAGEHAKCRAVISSSHVDSMAMASAFYPMSYNEVWLTGLPRNDFILREFDSLPVDMKAEESRLRELMQGRKLVLFMPTFRNAQDGAYYRFSEQEVAWIHGWLERNDAVLGVREHMADNARTYGTMLAGTRVLDASDAAFPDAEVLYRCSSALITDYSSCFIDHMLTGMPAICFAYDYESYANVERGSFYDLDFVFPGPVCRSFEQLASAMDDVFKPRTDAETRLFEWKRRLFFDHVDDKSSERLATMIKKLMDFDDMGVRLPVWGG